MKMTFEFELPREEFNRRKRKLDTINYTYDKETNIITIEINRDFGFEQIFKLF